MVRQGGVRLTVLLWGLLSAGVCAAGPTVSVVALDPSGEATLSAGEPLYLRIHYQSDRPLRFQADGGKSPDAMTNTVPLYPAGRGEAIAWIAYRRARTLDEVGVIVMGEDWQPLERIRVPVAVRWTDTSPEAWRQPAPWVAALNRAREERHAPAPATETAGGDLLVLLMGWSVPLYVLLQVLVWRRWRGGWRTAGLMPLWAMVPLVLYTVFALLAGSNLWPLIMLFLTPLFCGYLVLLFVLRTVARTR